CLFFVSFVFLYSFPSRRSSDLIVVCIIFTLLFVAGCTQDDGPDATKEGGSGSDGDLVVGMSFQEMNNPYFTSMKEAFEEAVESRSEEHTSELQSRFDLVCRLLL